MPAPAGANNRQRGSRRRAFEQAPPPCQRAPGCQPHARTANGVPSARHVPRPPVRAAPAHAPRPRAACFFPTTQLLTCDSTPTAGAFILQPVAAHACTFCLRAAATPWRLAHALAGTRTRHAPTRLPSPERFPLPSFPRMVLLSPAWNPQHGERHAAHSGTLSATPFKPGIGCHSAVPACLPACLPARLHRWLGAGCSPAAPPMAGCRPPCSGCCTPGASASASRCLRICQGLPEVSPSPPFARPLPIGSCASPFAGAFFQASASMAFGALAQAASGSLARAPLPPQR
jgi:hypothetical protein